MTFSQKILTGLAAGVATGLFLGEHATVFAWAAEGFVKLLQMTVLPYIMVSIVSSLGRLDFEQARAMAARVGAVIVGLWAVALTFAFLIPVTFPAVENASFFSTALIQPTPPFDFIGLYIPANPFHSMANNVVPAVVLFSVILGIALIGVERKQTLLDVLQVIGETVARATRMVTRLTPYGLFAIAATAAGTLNVEALGRIEIYLITYAAVALLVSFWALPGLVAALTPIPALDLLRTTRTALITAFVAGDLFIVLPALIEASKALMQRHGVLAADSSSLPDVIVPSSFTFPHSGKLLSLSFILFAGWFADAVVPLARYPQLALSGLISFFGSLNAAVPFLLNVFRIPADTFQLFLATGVINSRFGTLLAAVHTVSVALLGTCAMVGAVRWRRGPLVRYLVTTALLSTVVLGGARILFETWLRPEYHRDQVLAQMHLLRQPTGVVRTGLSAGPDAVTGSTLDRIRGRGALRVGYLPDSLPFAFTNARGELVGFDVELAHRLAAELGVSLEVVEVPRDQLMASVLDGDVDLVMSGIAITTLRASRLLFSTSYLDETVALLVLDHDRGAFSSWKSIADRGEIAIGVPGIPYFVDELRRLAPRATIVQFASVGELFAGPRQRVAAFALTAERGSAWTLLHPEYSVVVPHDRSMKIPLGYPIGRRDQEFAAFVNAWLDLKRKDGTLDALFRYWVMGENAAPAVPRWSIVRNVLHWLD